MRSSARGASETALLGRAVFRRITALLICVFLALDPAARAAVGDNPSAPAEENAEASYRGWDYLARRLEAMGVDSDTVRKIYSDSRMPQFGPIPFSVSPKEHASIYRGFDSKQKISSARAFLKLHERSFSKMRAKLAVTPAVVAAILLIESDFGGNTGREMVLNRLSRLSALGAPENVEFNFERLRHTDPTVTKEALALRASYLEETFTPEIPALLAIARQNKIDPLNVRGSHAGAFGMPQFLPSSYLNYGADGNGDRVISLFDPADAIFSAGNFLKHSGWRDGLSDSEKRKVIWKYNKSEEYISAVLRVAKQLDGARPVSSAPIKRRP